MGSAKRKASDKTQDAQGVAKEKVNQASESTKQATETARQKFNQTAGDASNKTDKVRPLFSTPLLVHCLIYAHVPGLSRLRSRGARDEEVISRSQNIVTTRHSIVSLIEPFSMKF